MRELWTTWRRMCTEGAKGSLKPKVGPLKPAEGAKALPKPKVGPLKLTEGAKAVPKTKLGPGNGLATDFLGIALARAFLGIA